MGVEEEFLLLDADGAVAPAAGEVLRLANADGRLSREYLAYQVETGTRVCTGLDRLRVELVELRRIAARGADRAGVRLVAAGATPFGTGPMDAVTDTPRYRKLARTFPDAI